MSTKQHPTTTTTPIATSTLPSPTFWKRFSTAAHQQEQKDAEACTKQASSDDEDYSPDIWLTRQEAKRSRRTFICWTFWIAFSSILAVVLVATIWMASSGMFRSWGKERHEE